MLSSRLPTSRPDTLPCYYRALAIGLVSPALVLLMDHLVPLLPHLGSLFLGLVWPTWPLATAGADD